MSTPNRSASVMTRTGALALGVVALLALLLVLGPALTPRGVRAVDATEPDRTISVAGTGIVTAVPDVADLHVGVVIQRATVKEARAAAATAMDGVVKALRAAGVAEKPTSRPRRSPSSPSTTTTRTAGPRRSPATRCATASSATVRDLDKLADAVDGALAAGRRRSTGSPSGSTTRAVPRARPGRRR